MTVSGVVESTSISDCVSVALAVAVTPVELVLKGAETEVVDVVVVAVVAVVEAEGTLVAVEPETVVEL